MAKPELKFLLGVPRSGTTILQFLLCQHERNRGIYEPFTREVSENGHPVFSLFQPKDSPLCHPVLNEDSGKNIIVKDVMGKYFKEHKASIFSVLEEHDITPTFMFREPYDAFASATKDGWYDFDTYFDMYVQSHRVMLDSIDKGEMPAVVTYESLSSQPMQVLSSISHHWKIPFVENSIALNRPYREAIFIKDEQYEGLLERNTHPRIIAENDPIFAPEKSPHALVLTAEQKERLDNEIMPLYEQVCLFEAAFLSRNSAHQIRQQHAGIPIADIRQKLALAS